SRVEVDRAMVDEIGADVQRPGLDADPDPQRDVAQQGDVVIHDQLHGRVGHAGPEIQAAPAHDRLIVGEGATVEFEGAGVCERARRGDVYGAAVLVERARAG